jgi:DNA-binding LytR/AlgR family response regulator
VLRNESIDLMFLDIQMPGMLGTQLLQSLRPRPLVIFVTAYANYAVESYELEVVDYLLKPVSLERFTRAAYKALEVHQAKQANPLAVSPAEETELDSFFVNVEYSLVKIVVNDICHIESMKDYVKIFLTTAPKPILTKATLKSMEERLPSHAFMRVHKSYLVCLDKIETIRSQGLTIGPHEIPVSETHREELLKRVQG